MKCTEYAELNLIEKFISKWIDKDTGPHHYLVDDYDIKVWTANKSFAHSAVYLKCRDCGHRKRIDESPYSKDVLIRMKKAQEVFTDGGATFKR